MGTIGQPAKPAVPTLRVRTQGGQVLRFTRSFHIGRGEECEVRIDDAHVSRRHLCVEFDNGRWSLRDLRSANGVFAKGRRIESSPIDAGLTVTLGADGPTVALQLEHPGPANEMPRTRVQDSSSDSRETMLLASYVDRYFGAKDSGPVGRRTMMIRKAFDRVQKRQQRAYGAIVVAVSLIALGAAGYALYSHQRMNERKAMAQELFYAMKTLDVDLANLERLIAASEDPEGRKKVNMYLERRRQMERTYDRFITDLKVYNRDLTEPERLILRVTRLFGECELAAPPEYLDEVNRYISRWVSTQRFARAVALAEQRGYTRRIADEFLANNLPPQFFYLAMQESDFDPFITGPPTRYGYAKGMWQFIPDTGQRYGLKIGPLAAVPQADAADDRHNWDKATVAAARYIKDIYSTDAQASGLLVMASYNWGERRVVDLIQTLSPNPKDRNFWKLLERYRERIPKQTYDYVFYIVSAAVIGENPRMFGFPFDSPLKFLETEHSAVH